MKRQYLTAWFRTQVRAKRPEKLSFVFDHVLDDTMSTLIGKQAQAIPCEAMAKMLRRVDSLVLLQTDAVDAILARSQVPSGGQIRAQYYITCLISAENREDGSREARICHPT